MTVFEVFKSMNIDEFSEWLDKYGMFDGSPWIKWWDKTHCQECEPVIYNDRYVECWCNLNNNKCKFFPDMKERPDNAQMIKLWLETNAE